jgi:prepilin-type N-terminal cleavage/methylation domain-containing protein/prepilin-type processing-associated H-X9-DG protein
MLPISVPRIRKGFTLIELITVIAIIAVLGGLLMGSVQRARAAVARVSCADRLRQHGLALHGYHAAYSVFPPGQSLMNGKADFPYLGWQARLLPYMDQSPLWEQIGQEYAKDKVFWHVPPHANLSTVVKIFTCPADYRVESPGIIPNFPPVGLSSYLGVCGLSFRKTNGVLYSDSRVRIADISDGTSCTLAAGERPPSTDLRFGWWYAGTGQDLKGSVDMFLGVAEFNILTYLYPCPFGPYEFGPGSFNNECDMFHFWSPHPSGANFLFVDGSVHFLTYSAAPILPALASRAGGETVVIPD